MSDEEALEKSLGIVRYTDIDAIRDCAAILEKLPASDAVSVAQYMLDKARRREMSEGNRLAKYLGGLGPRAAP